MQNKTYNVRITQHSGAFVPPFLQWKNNMYYTFSECGFSLRYPACKTRAPFCHLWPIRLYNIFPHFLIKGTISEKKLLKIKCVLSFSIKFVWNISQSKANRARYDKKCILVFMQSSRYSCQDLNEIRIFSTGFRKIFEFQISWKSAQWEPICSIRTDRRDEANSRYSQFTI
jgi:hypothetical protein